MDIRILVLLVGLCPLMLLMACPEPPPPVCEDELSRDECTVYCYGFNSMYAYNRSSDFECGEITCEAGQHCCNCHEKGDGPTPVPAD